MVKAAGTSGIIDEMLKASSDMGVGMVTDLINSHSTGHSSQLHEECDCEHVQGKADVLVWQL